ncbi:MAG: hypothetical protein EON55_24890, partial [Alphaproteobacteria bacterium]
HRGFRMELGEIEAALTRLPGVRAAAVVLRGSGTDEHLAAFVVSSGFDQRSLRVGLGECLPSYMVPAAFHVPDALPRSTTAAARTPGNRVRAASISPSSIRKPRCLTWLSSRPCRCSCPRSSTVARSPVRYMVG